MARPTNEMMLASGLAEIALGALVGWPYALAVSDPERAKQLGFRSNQRLRQWHLDLIALGALTAMCSQVAPDLPRRAAVPLTVGAWTNANTFGVLTFRPQAVTHPVFRAATFCSFAAVSWGWCATATLVARRSRRQRRRYWRR